MGRAVCGCGCGCGCGVRWWVRVRVRVRVRWWLLGCAVGPWSGPGTGPPGRGSGPYIYGAISRELAWAGNWRHKYAPGLRHGEPRASRTPPLRPRPLPSVGDRPPVTRSPAGSGPVRGRVRHRPSHLVGIRARSASGPVRRRALLRQSASSATVPRGLGLWGWSSLLAPPRPGRCSSGGQESHKRLVPLAATRGTAPGWRPLVPDLAPATAGVGEAAWGHRRVGADPGGPEPDRRLCHRRVAAGRREGAGSEGWCPGRLRVFVAPIPGPRKFPANGAVNIRSRAPPRRPRPRHPPHNRPRTPARPPRVSTTPRVPRASLFS